MSAVLPTQADKPRYVAEMFGRIAGRYDLMNTLMTGGQDARWRRAVADAVLGHGVPSRVLDDSPSTGVSRPPVFDVGTATGVSRPRVLDVGTGTGKLAMAILARAPTAQVVGVDFTESMLRAAPPGLTLATADALALPFADGSFDAVVSAFVVRNLADVRAGIAEQVRVLRPGGRLVVLETTPGPPGVLRPPYRLYFRHVVPRLGQLIAGDPSAYTYLPESTLAFLEPSRLADVLRRAGLTEITIQRLALGSVALLCARKPAA